MKESELNINVNKVLNEFETLENIQPSADWNQSLMIKISSSRTHSNSKSTSPKFIVLILLIVLANIGFVLSTMMSSSQQSITHNEELNTISNELLINPTSLNN